jgi:hypothetical protein
MLTAAPSCASFLAMALPIPRLPPVTSATWPAKDFLEMMEWLVSGTLVM